MFTTSSCYRSCQFGGCAPKTPGGARARFQVRWMGAAPPKTPALPRSGTRTGGARAKLGCGFSLRRHLFLSRSLHPSLLLSLSHLCCYAAQVQTRAATATAGARVVFPSHFVYLRFLIHSLTFQLLSHSLTNCQLT